MKTVLISLDRSSLAISVAAQLSLPLHQAQLTRFADGEITITLPPEFDCFKARVLVIHGTFPPVHERIIQAVLLAHALKNAHAAEIIGIMPYFGYARHDKPVAQGMLPPVAAIIRVLEGAGYDRIITTEIHARSVLQLFTVPATSIDSSDLILNVIATITGGADDFCLVSPDKGGIERVQKLAQRSGLSTIFFTKQRYGPDQTKLVACESQCTAKKAIVIDDIIDSGRTALNVGQALKAQGFTQIYGIFVHPVFSGSAWHDMQQGIYDALYVSNTIDLQNSSAMIRLFDLGPLIARQISAE